MDNKINKTGILEMAVGAIMYAVPSICEIILVARAGRAYTEGFGLFVQTPLDKPGEAHSEMVTVSDTDAASALKVGGILQDLDLISSRYAFAVKARLTGYSHSILPGTYVISSDMTMEQILVKLSADPAAVPAGEEQDGTEAPEDSTIKDSQEENKDVWGQG